MPASYKNAYDGLITDSHRKTFAGMLSCADEGIGNVSKALAAKGMLNNTLLVFSTGERVANAWALLNARHGLIPAQIFLQTTADRCPTLLVATMSDLGISHFAAASTRWVCSNCVCFVSHFLVNLFHLVCRTFAPACRSGKAALVGMCVVGG